MRETGEKFGVTHQRVHQIVSPLEEALAVVLATRDVLLTQADVALICRVSKAAVNGWLRSGKLKHVKLGRAKNSLLRIRREDLDEFIEFDRNKQPESEGEPDGGRTYTVREAAELCGLGLTSVYRLIHQGRLVPFRTTGKYGFRLTQEQVDKIKEARELCGRRTNDAEA